MLATRLNCSCSRLRLQPSRKPRAPMGELDHLPIANIRVAHLECPQLHRVVDGFYCRIAVQSLKRQKTSNFLTSPTTTPAHASGRSTLWRGLPVPLPLGAILRAASRVARALPPVLPRLERVPMRNEKQLPHRTAL